MSAVELIVVYGEYTGHLNDGTMEWTCPFTNERLMMSGQFYVSDDNYVHMVRDEDGRNLYVVIGREVKS